MFNISFIFFTVLFNKIFNINWKSFLFIMSIMPTIWLHPTWIRLYCRGSVLWHFCVIGVHQVVFLLAAGTGCCVFEWTPPVFEIVLNEVFLILILTQTVVERVEFFTGGVEWHKFFYILVYWLFLFVRAVRPVISFILFLIILPFVWTF